MDPEIKELLEWYNNNPNFKESGIEEFLEPVEDVEAFLTEYESTYNTNLENSTFKRGRISEMMIDYLYRFSKDHPFTSTAKDQNKIRRVFPYFWKIYGKHIHEHDYVEQIQKGNYLHSLVLGRDLNLVKELIEEYTEMDRQARGNHEVHQIYQDWMMDHWNWKQEGQQPYAVAWAAWTALHQTYWLDEDSLHTIWENVLTERKEFYKKHKRLPSWGGPHRPSFLELRAREKRDRKLAPLFIKAVAEFESNLNKLKSRFGIKEVDVNNIFWVNAENLQGDHQHFYSQAGSGRFKVGSKGWTSSIFNQWDDFYLEINLQWKQILKKYPELHYLKEEENQDDN